LFILLSLVLSLLLGLASLGLLLGGAYMAWGWWSGQLLAIGWLICGAVMLLFALLGRSLVLLLYPKGEDEPKRHRAAGMVVRGTNGSTLHIETAGPADAPTLVLTHGWGFDSSAWYYIRRDLQSSFRIVTWDLPGLGGSATFADGRYSIERFAENLRIVVDEVPGPLVLVGHSIGGMTMLSFCRQYRSLLGGKVVGLVLLNTTYTDPLRTTVGGDLLPAVQKPVAKLLLHAMRLLWPVVWWLNWQSFLSGSAHLLTRLTSFGPKVTRGQLDFAARFATIDHPAVVAKGLLCTFDWDESETLAGIPLRTLVLAGSNDRLTVPAASRHIATAIPRAELSEMRPAGHSGIVERGRSYSAAIARWVESLARCRDTRYSTARRKRPGRSETGALKMPRS